jgi:hypothetical protein
VRLLGAAERVGESVYSLPVSANDLERAGVLIGDLPADVGFDGGAARNILESLVHDCRLNRPPRDIDLMLFEGGSSTYVSVQNTRHTREHGIAVEIHSGPKLAHSELESYMRQRDITLNQVLFQSDGHGGGRLYCTAQAAQDMASMTVRPCVFEQHEVVVDGKKVMITRDRIVLKALRLAAEYQADGIDAKIGGIDFWRGIHFSERAAFQEILSLNKILERGVEATRRYMAMLRGYGLARERTPEKLAKVLEKDVWGFTFTPTAQTTLNTYHDAPPVMMQTVHQAIGTRAYDLLNREVG